MLRSPPVTVDANVGIPSSSSDTWTAVRSAFGVMMVGHTSYDADWSFASSLSSESSAPDRKHSLNPTTWNVSLAFGRAPWSMSNMKSWKSNGSTRSAGSAGSPPARTNEKFSLTVLPPATVIWPNFEFPSDETSPFRSGSPASTKEKERTKRNREKQRNRNRETESERAREKEEKRADYDTGGRALIMGVRSQVRFHRACEEHTCA